MRDVRVIDVRVKARDGADERLLDLLLPPVNTSDEISNASAVPVNPRNTREKIREQLHAGLLDERVVEVDVEDKTFPSFEVVTGSSVEEIDINMKEMLPNLFQGRARKRSMKIQEALQYLTQEEEKKLVAHQH